MIYEPSEACTHKSRHVKRCINLLVANIQNNPLSNHVWIILFSSPIDCKAHFKLLYVRTMLLSTESKALNMR